LQHGLLAPPPRPLATTLRKTILDEEVQLTFAQSKKLRKSAFEKILLP